MSTTNLLLLLIVGTVMLLVTARSWLEWGDAGRSAGRRLSGPDSTSDHDG